MTLFIEHKGDTWIAKPDRPFGRLQIDLYMNAFDINQKTFGTHLDLEEIDSRIYVSKKSWLDLVGRINKKNLEEIESITAEREDSVRQFMNLALSFPLTYEGARQMLNSYEQAVSFFHFRWNLGNIVEGRLKEQIRQLPAHLRSRVFSIIPEQQDLETVKSGDYFSETLRIIKEKYKAEFEKGTNLKLIPEIWQRITFLAEEFAHVHNEDIRIPIPYDYVGNELKNHLYDEFPIREKREKKSFEKEIRPHVKDWDVFYRTIKLAFLQGSQKENEHHFQVRGQNRMKKKLDFLAQELADEKVIYFPEQIYEMPATELLSVFSKKDERRALIKC